VEGSPPYTFYAPSSLQGHLHSGGSDAFSVFLTDEERMRGIILDKGYISKEELQGQRGYSGLYKDANPEEAEGRVRELVHGIVNYSFQQRRLASRPLQGHGVFNPHLVVGLPAAIVDRHSGHHVGPLAQVIHTLDQANGTFSTSFTLRDVRWIGRPKKDYLPEWFGGGDAPEGIHVGDEAKPSWFDPSFADDKVGETVWGPLLGYTDKYQGSILRPHPTDDRLETMEEALNRIRSECMGAQSPRASALLWTRREIATEMETFLALGCEPDDDDEVKELGEKDLGDADVWADVRNRQHRSYRNPGGTQSYKDEIPESGAPGPFFKERRDWALDIAKETLQEGHAY
jgi:hypothetical protein